MRSRKWQTAADSRGGRGDLFEGVCGGWKSTSVGAQSRHTRAHSPRYTKARVERAPAPLQVAVTWHTQVYTSVIAHAGRPTIHYLSQAYTQIYIFCPVPVSHVPWSLRRQAGCSKSDRTTNHGRTRRPWCHPLRGAGLARGKLCYLRAAGCGSRIGDAELLPSPGLRASHCSLLVFLESDGELINSAPAKRS